MQAITIAERLWLEPTILGVTLNYSEQPNGWHYRVGLGYRSLGECAKALEEKGRLWVVQDQSLMIQEGTDLMTLIFCPGTPLEQRLVLSGEELHTFKNAIQFLALASEPQRN